MKFLPAIWRVKN